MNIKYLITIFFLINLSIVNANYFSEKKNIVIKKIKKYYNKNKKSILAFSLLLSSFLLYFLKIKKYNKKDDNTSNNIDQMFLNKNYSDLNELIKNNDTESIELRKKIERSLNRQIFQFIEFLNNNYPTVVLYRLPKELNPKVWRIAKGVNSIGELFAQGYLREEDKTKIRKIFFNLDPLVQNKLIYAIFETIK